MINRLGNILEHIYKYQNDLALLLMSIIKGLFKKKKQYIFSEYTIIPIPVSHFTRLSTQISFNDRLYGFNKSEFRRPHYAILSM